MIQGGRAQIRATLYMGAVVAMRHNPVIKTFYERLVGRGKSKKLALTACVRKILVILNAMVRQNQPCLHYSPTGKNLIVRTSQKTDCFSARSLDELLAKAFEDFPKSS